MISNNDLRMIRAATALSLNSPYPRIHIGAVVARKNVVLGMGFNRPKSHPLQKKYNELVGRVTKNDCLHAEMDALNSCYNEDLSGCVMYVSRLSKDYKNAMCRPCAACMQAMKDRYIERTVYLTTDGIAEEHIGAKD